MAKLKKKKFPPHQVGGIPLDKNKSVLECDCKIALILPHQWKLFSFCIWVVDTQIVAWPFSAYTKERMCWRVFCCFFFFPTGMFLFIDFWLFWIFVAASRLFSSCGRQGLLSSSGALLFQSMGCRAHRLQQLWLPGSRAQAQYLWRTGSVAGWYMVIFLDQG